VKVGSEREGEEKGQHTRSPTGLGWDLSRGSASFGVKELLPLCVHHADGLQLAKLAANLRGINMQRLKRLKMQTYIARWQLRWLGHVCRMPMTRVWRRSC
jgi:hypothetical protein